jgi:ankyrin repeat protein
MCERGLPVDLFPVLALHLEREDVVALSVSCVSAARGLTETRAPLVDWIVDRCVRLHGESPLASAVALASAGWDGREGHREGRAAVVHAALRQLLRRLRGASGPAACVDAVRALCAASARGYERAVGALGDGAPLSGLVHAAPRAGLMAAVHAEVGPRASCWMPTRSARDAAGPLPTTRLEAAYRALLETRSARVAARLLDWAPEVEPEHVIVVCPFFGRVHSLVHCVCATRRADVLREILARRGALAGFRAAMLDRDDARRLETPLHAAMRDEGAEVESPAAVVRALLEAGAWHSPRDGDARTPLHLAARRGCAGAACVRLLLEAGADPAGRDVFGRTPLQLAAECGCGACADACCVRALLEAGADPTLRDSFGHTPLHFAHSADAARRLIDAGADPNNVEQCNDGPLHYAVQRRTPDVVHVLLAAGADPNRRNVHGRTALHCACNEEVVEVVVEAGARLDARDNTGQTPLERAVARAHCGPEHTQLIEALVKANVGKKYV